MITLSRLGLILMAVALCLPVAANDARLDPIVVTATRVPTELSNVAAPVIVIQRDDIARSGAQDLAQLLRFHAGLDVGRNGGPGQTTSVFMRGAESNHTLVLVDGVRINPGTIGGAALQNIRPQIIERVEILKGPRSSLYGSEAIGGVINVITRGNGGERRAEMTVGAGQDNARTASVTYGAGGDRVSFDATLAYTDSDGFPARDFAATDSGHDNLSAKLGVQWRIGAATANARGWRASGATEFVDFSGAAVEQDYTNQVAGIGLSVPLSERWDSALDVSVATDDIEQKQVPDFATTRRLTSDWKNTIDLGNDHVLLAGVYAHREDTDSLVFGLPFDEATDVLAVYVEDNLQRNAHSLSYAARYTDHEAFGGETTWHMDYGFDATGRLTLTAGASTGFRAPDATDRFGFGGNPDLAAETSTNVELGARYRASANQRLELSVFSLDIDNLIIFNFDPATLDGQNENIERAGIRGFEARYVVSRGAWGLSAAAVLQDPKNETSGEPLPRRARRSLSINAFRRFQGFELGLDVLATDQRKDSDFSADYNAGYVLANLSGRVALGRHFELRGKIENLLATDYQTARGFNTPGRGLYLDIVYANP